MNTDRWADEIVVAIQSLEVLNVPTVRVVRREYSAKLRKESAELVVAIGNALVDRGGEYAKLMGYELITCHRPALKSIGLAELQRLGRGMDDWASTDTFGIYLSGPAWLNDQISAKDVDAWIGDESRWWRRAALVSTVCLSRRGLDHDRRRTLHVCSQLVGDRDDMVVKGLSWALRELTKHHRDDVEIFLSGNEKHLASRVKREVGNKLRTGLKSGGAKRLVG